MGDLESGFTDDEDLEFHEVHAEMLGLENMNPGAPAELLSQAALDYVKIRNFLFAHGISEYEFKGRIHGLEFHEEISPRHSHIAAVAMLAMRDMIREGLEWGGPEREDSYTKMFEVAVHDLPAEKREAIVSEAADWIQRARLRKAEEERGE